LLHEAVRVTCWFRAEARPSDVVGVAVEDLTEPAPAADADIDESVAGWRSSRRRYGPASAGSPRPPGADDRCG
jgi:hypothetical protein